MCDKKVARFLSEVQKGVCAKILEGFCACVEFLLSLLYHLGYFSSSILSRFLCLKAFDMPCRSFQTFQGACLLATLYLRLVVCLGLC